VPRVISFIVLLAIVLLVGAIFFQVMAQFFVPLFLACVLLVVFEPLHRWMGARLPRRPRLAAMLTTFSIILVVVLPLVYLGWKAYVDFYAVLHRPAITETAAQPQQAAPVKPSEPAAETSPAADGRVVIGEQLDEEKLGEKLKHFAKRLVVPVEDKFHVKIQDDYISRAVDWASGFAGKVVLTGVQSVLGVLIGMFILVIALYYFLADGPVMIQAVMAVSPLDQRYEQELLQRFAQVSRAVVVATLLTALTQGALAGIGYAFALSKEAPVFLLTALTTVSALIPLFGAFAVWACVCIWIYVQGDPVTAIVLAVYCTIVVSAIDNIMKPLILHGQSKLHPLLALLSILGGIQAFGPVGILVGPMLVSFLQALLNMLRKELDSFGAPAGASSKPLAESMVEAIQLAASENATAGPASAAQLTTENHDSTAAIKPPPVVKVTAARREKRRR
jgi:predicted PurR-regulated permease PerM